jgi:maleylacetoacetate isomerase
VRDGGEQHRPEYSSINPMRQVPTLCIDGVTLTQSMPIIEYLDETRPDPPLLPTDPVTRAVARQFAEIINAGIQPVQNLAVLQRLEREFNADGGQKKAWGRAAIETGFDALEHLVSATAGSCCIGDTVTIADLFLVPQLYNARRFGVALALYPTLTRIEAHLETLPAFVAAHAHEQPDTLDELRGTLRP